jgi:hypothetical protein
MPADRSFVHLPEEQWRVIVDFPDYDISNCGRVVSRRRGMPRLLSMRPMGGGRPGALRYFQVALYGRDGRVERHVAHLVLEAFTGPRPEGMEARHLNSDPQDNRLENLAWGTKAENAQDKVDRRARCKNNHLLDAWTRNGNKRARRCNECRREAYRAPR